MEFAIIRRLERRRFQLIGGAREGVRYYKFVFKQAKDGGQSMTRTELRAALSIGLLYIVRMLGLFMVLPVLPLVADEYPGATPLLVGLAIGIYGLSQAALQIPLGLLSDRIGRKPVLYGGLLIFIVGSVLAAATDNIYGIIAGRFLQGCGALASTLLALVSDVTRAEHRSKAMAIIGISIASSFGLALIIGPYISSIAGVSGLFWFAAALGGAGLAVLIAVVPNPTVKSRNPEAILSTQLIGSVFSNTDIRRAVVGIFLLHYLLMSSFVVLPVLMQGTGQIEDAEHHLYYFWLLAGSFVCMTPFMWLSDNPRYTRGLLLAMVGFFIVASLNFALLDGYWPLMVGIVVFFMAFNLLEVIFPSLVSKVSRVGERGTAMGLYSTAQFAGGFAGGFLGGYIVFSWDIAYLMYTNVALCSAWLLYSVGLSQPGNYRTITLLLQGEGDVSATSVTDALLSVDGVLDVALIPEERLAYLKVDKDIYNQEAMARVRVPELEVVST